MAGRGPWQLGSRGAAVSRWAQGAAFVWDGMSKRTALAVWHWGGDLEEPLSEPPGSEHVGAIITAAWFPPPCILPHHSTIFPTFY